MITYPIYKLNNSITVHHKTISIINNFINLFAAQVINGYVMERNKIDKQPESLRQYNNLHWLLDENNIACTSNSISLLLLFFQVSADVECVMVFELFFLSFFRFSIFLIFFMETRTENSE